MRCLLGLIAAVALGACSRQSQPAHFFAEGRPPKLSDWHMVYADGGRLALNGGVIPYDLNTPLLVYRIAALSSRA